MRSFKKMFFVIIAILSLGIFVGYAAMNSSFNIEGSTIIGVSLEDQDFYIGNLFIGSVNRFNSINIKDDKFRVTVDKSSITARYYLVNNSTQYEAKPTVTCVPTDINGNPVENSPLTIRSNNLSAASIKPQSFIYGTLQVSSSDLDDVYYYTCSVDFAISGTNSKTTATKTIVYAADGLTFPSNSSTYALKTYSASSTTYGDLSKSNPTVTDGTFNYWKNALGIQITSSLKLPDKADEILYADYSINICNYQDGDIVYSREGFGTDTFTALCAGTYFIEISGAQGGTAKIGDKKSVGGYGGSASMTIDLDEFTDLYINIGGMPDITSATPAYPDFATVLDGGNNGGGNGASAYIDQFHLLAAAPGGGATSIALSLGANGSRALSSYNTDDLKDNVLLVAGGGGGGIVYSENPAETQLNGQLTPSYVWYNNKGGYGGGTRGYTGILGDSRTSCPLTGDDAYTEMGTVTGGDGGGPSSGGNGDTPGTFGQGGNGYTSSTVVTAGGGGGWYGGGSGVGYKGAAGGGSGYYNRNLATDGSLSANQKAGGGNVTITYVTMI